MVPTDPASLTTAIDAALIRLDARVKRDATSVDATRGGDREAGVAVFNRLRQSVDETIKTLRSQSPADQNERSPA